MLVIVSNHLLKVMKVEFPHEHIVVRINVAWIPTKEALMELLSKTTHDVFLDFPQGRSKPPRPTLTLDEIIEIVPQFKNIKYFAISNVEDPIAVAALKTRLPHAIELIPKIETKIGIEGLEAIIKSIDAKHIMLDKEDIYTNVHHDHKLFEDLVDRARSTCKDNNVQVLELQGVVFAPHE